MDFDQLKNFITVAEFEHMTKAAEALHMGQPTLSQSIAKLETELGVSLFDRVGRNIRLNSYGHVFLKYACGILEQMDAANAELSSLRESKESQEMRIRYWVSSSMIPELLVSFSKMYPYIRFQSVGDSDDYDFLFSFSSYSAPPPSPFEILLQEEICIAVPLSHPLAKQDSVDLSALKGEKFISVSNRLPFRSVTDEFCRMAGFEPTVILENEDYRTLELLLNIGAGISFWPAKSWRSVMQLKQYKLLHISYPICMRTIYLSWHEGTLKSHSSRIFRDFSRSFFNQRHNDIDNP